MRDIEARTAAIALVSASLTCNHDQQAELMRELCSHPCAARIALSELVLACARLTEQIGWRAPGRDLLSIWSAYVVQENRVLYRD